ncbi:hypothetical protein E2C01_047453 [Portunus trituberculatus]|uniref:Uncharacterized protein n=1 Tax=Portunus trituberculatus TaxID=210409 RepID=A0A5B7G8W6_PORTR|nr:hypothetical protein [Portunus trituberculatus]
MTHRLDGEETDKASWTRQDKARQGKAHFLLRPSSPNLCHLTRPITIFHLPSSALLPPLHRRAPKADTHNTGLSEFPAGALAQCLPFSTLGHAPDRAIVGSRVAC